MTGNDFGRILDEWEQNKGRRPEAPGNTTRKVFENAIDRYLPDPEDEKFQESGPRQPAREFASMPSEAALDLHGFPAIEAEKLVRNFLDTSARQGLKKVTIIHGKGNHSKEGVSRLRTVVFRELEKSPFAGKQMRPPREHGGSGAVWVSIRAYRSR